MANLNLSEFTEKLFVADADHTFIWDSAVSISKRVSRNSWLNSGTLTSDAPVTISQTWNQIGTAFTAFKVNATSTASADASRLLDLQVGGVSKLSVTKAGTINFGEVQANFDPYISRVALGTLAVSLYGFNQNHVSMGYAGGGSSLPGVTVSSGGQFAWSSSSTNSEATRDTILLRDSASGNTLALRNGTVPQTFNVYGTYTSASVYERMFMRYNGTDLAFQVGAETLGATARPLQLWTGGASRLHITTAGNVGIGTTAPGAKLQVVGNAIFGENSISTSIVNVSFGGSYGTAVAGSKANLKWDLFNDGAGNRSGIGISSGIFEFQVSAGAGFGFYPNGSTTSALQIISSGNVGIGTTSPTSKLHVEGTIRAYKNATDYTTNIPAAGISGYLNATGITTQLKFDDGSGNGTGAGLYLPNNGIVGWQSLARTDAGTLDTILQRDGEADHLAMRRSTNGQKFSVYGTYPGAAWERFTITAPTSGNVLLGTYKGTGGIARGLEFQTDGVTRMTIDAAGTLISATSVINAASFSVTGSNILALSHNGISISLGTSGWNTQHNGPYFQLGGSTNAFPAISRDGAGIKFTGASAGSTSWVKVPPVAVTALPDATVAGVGARAFVNDALAPTFGSAVTGGGSVPVPVYSTGSAWNVG